MKQLYLGALLFVTTSSFAGIFDSKLTIFRCPQNAVGLCDSSCKKDNPPMQLEIKVSKTNKAVQQIVYRGGEQIGSIVLESCVIFDDKNWSCEPATGVIGSRKMANGIYSDTTQIIGFSGKSDLPPANLCAK